MSLTGKKICKSCHGTGWVKDPKSKKFGIKTCTKCDGKGYTN